jgi:hypothetical protein
LSADSSCAPAPRHRGNNQFPCSQYGDLSTRAPTWTCQGRFQRALVCPSSALVLALRPQQSTRHGPKQSTHPRPHALQTSWCRTGDEKAPSCATRIQTSGTLGDVGGPRPETFTTRREKLACWHKSLSLEEVGGGRRREAGQGLTRRGGEEEHGEGERKDGPPHGWGDGEGPRTWHNLLHKIDFPSTVFRQKSISPRFRELTFA